MDKKFEITLKDAVFIISLLFTAAGSWYSQSTRIREMELKFEAQTTINAMTIKNLEGRIDVLTTQQVQYPAGKKR